MNWCIQPILKPNIISVSGELDKDYSNLDSFIIYMCVKGTFDIVCNTKHYSLNIGETILIPATIKSVKIEAESAILLEIYM